MLNRLLWCCMQLREMRPFVDCKEPIRWRHITKDGKKKFLMVRNGGP